MSSIKIYGAKPKRMYINGLKVKKAYCMGERVWSAGSTVTYICNGVTYTEEVDEGQTVLSPTSFTPSKSGCSFVGWSTSASSTATVSSLVMSGKPITLYAVFKYNDLTRSLGGYYHLHSTPDASVDPSYSIDHGSVVIASGINTSLYSGLKLSIYEAHGYSDFRGSSWNIYLKAGGASTLIMNPYVDWGNPATSHPVTLGATSFTLNFTQTSGTTSLTIYTYCTDTGNGVGHSTGGGYVYANAITYLGRTIVG